MSFFKKASAQEIVGFTQNLAVMLKSGITINEALASLAIQAKSNSFREVLGHVQKELEMGVSLSSALSKEEATFGPVFLSVLRAGEKSGMLEENLNFVAGWLERNNDLRKEIKAAMFYPKIVITITVILGGGLAVFILPKLVPLFSQLRVELPIVTKIMLAISIFLQKFWLLVFLGGIAGAVLFLFLSRLKPVKRILHYVSLRLPFFGGLTTDYQLALVSQLFATLFKSGLSMQEVLHITEHAATNVYYRESITNMTERVNNGVTLAEAMSAYTKLYPANFENIVKIGEKSGTLEASFFHLSEFYTKSVKNKTKRLPSIIEPMLLIFIGVAIGFVALSIIMPIYQLTSGLSG